MRWIAGFNQRKINLNIRNEGHHQQQRESWACDQTVLSVATYEKGFSQSGRSSRALNTSIRVTKLKNQPSIIYTRGV